MASEQQEPWPGYTELNERATQATQTVTDLQRAHSEALSRYERAVTLQGLDSELAQKAWDTLVQVHERYARAKTESRFEIWTFAHQPPRIRKGKVLRIITSLPARVRWSADNWQSVHDSETQDTSLSCHSADLATAELPPATRIRFTFRWPDRWEGRDFTVEIAD